jgi:hypothetical protein
MTLQERINHSRTLSKNGTEKQIMFNILDNQIAIMEALIRIEPKSELFCEQVNDPAKWDGIKKDFGC